MCHVWACTIEQNAMPVLILIAYFLTPLPRLLGNICDQGNMFSAMQPAVPLSRLWGDFGTAFIGLWVLGIPALLVHAEKLAGTSMILELVGMGLLVVSLGLLHRQTQRTAPPRLGY